MKHVTANTARSDFDELLHDVIELGEPVSIATDIGAAILICQEEWSSLQETIYLHSVPGMVESINEARNALASERLESVGWDIS